MGAGVLFLGWLFLSSHLFTWPFASKADCRKATPRLHCMVPTLYNKEDMESLDSILVTWGQFCNSIAFYTEPGGSEPLPTDLLHRHGGLAAPIVLLRDLVRNGHEKQCVEDALIPSPCMHTWEKTWRMLLFASKTAVDTADYFLKVDDDTLVFPAQVRAFITERGWQRADDAHYFGHELFQEQGEPRSSYAAGAFYGLSRGALKIMGEVLEGMQHYSAELHESQARDWTVFTCYDRPGGADDVMVGRCLHSVGLAVEDVSDAQGASRVALLEGGEWADLPPWYRRGKSLLRLKPGMKQASDAPVAVHAATLAHHVKVRRMVWESLTGPEDLGAEASGIFPRGWVALARRHLAGQSC